MNLNELINNNMYINIVLTILIALYAGVIAPALPNSVITFFDTVFGKILFVFLIAYTAGKNIEIALILSIALVITLDILNKRQVELFNSDIEKFSTIESEDGTMSEDPTQDPDSMDGDPVVVPDAPSMGEYSDPDLVEDRDSMDGDTMDGDTMDGTGPDSENEGTQPPTSEDDMMLDAPMINIPESVPVTEASSQLGNIPSIGMPVPGPRIDNDTDNKDSAATEDAQSLDNVIPGPGGEGFINFRANDDTCKYAPY